MAKESDMNGFIEQSSFDEVFAQEPTRLKVQWNEGMPFDVELQKKSKIRNGLRMDVADIFRPGQGKFNGYTDFLKRAN